MNDTLTRLLPEATETDTDMPTGVSNRDGATECEGEDLNPGTPTGQRPQRFPENRGHSSATSTKHANLPDSIRSVFHEVYGRELILVQHPAGDRWMDEAEVTGSDF